MGIGNIEIGIILFIGIIIGIILRNIILKIREKKEEPKKENEAETMGLQEKALKNMLKTSKKILEKKQYQKKTEDKKREAITRHIIDLNEISELIDDETGKAMTEQELIKELKNYTVEELEEIWKEQIEEARKNL